MNSKLFYMSCLFSGRVQGVGFRYQVISIAKGFELTGYVRNLSDGRVQILAEGNKSEVISFIEIVESEMDSFIKSTEKEKGTAYRKYNNFSIIS